MEGRGALMAARYSGLRKAVTLFLRAYRELVCADLLLTFRGFPALHERVERFRPLAAHLSVSACQEICRAVDVACVFYFKEVRCLQRSAATACLLRQNGIHAELVIGVQQWPFRAHAWVEVAGRVMNDKPYVRESFAVIDRC
jgi:hypothetical protein